MGHPHAVDEEIFEVREGHFRCLINFTIHRITTMGEIKRIPKRNNFKNNCRNSILTLCLSLHGLVIIQTTNRNNPPKIKILTIITMSHFLATSQVDFWQGKNFWKSDMESFSPGTVHLRIFFRKVMSKSHLSYKGASASPFVKLQTSFYFLRFFSVSLRDSGSPSNSSSVSS